MAQGPEAEKDAMLFLESISMPKKAVVCSARLAGFTSKFDPAYAKWKDANAALLAQGEAFLRAEATAAKMDFNFHVTLLAEMAAKSLASASQSILEENCDDLLQILGTSRSE
jgi:hypothetical protein